MKTTQSPTYQLTPSDKLFYQLMGFYPAKAGTAFELISTAVTMIITPHEEAKHDVTLIGHTQAPHQIDGMVDDIAIEAKDHSAGKKQVKVSIGEVMKHETAICDLKETTKGLFFSSSGFSPNAMQFAEGLSEDIHQKLIQLLHSRPSAPKDEKGRIMRIQVNLEFKIPDYKYQVLLPDNVLIKLKNGNKNVRCQNILYDAQGRMVSMFDDVVDELYPDLNIDVQGQKVDTPNKYILTDDNRLFPLDGFICSRTIRTESHPFEVAIKGKPVLLVKSDSLNINKLFTDVELKEEIEKLLH